MLQLNDKSVNYFHFSGGEIQVKLPELINEERVKLTWKPTQTVDIMLLMLTVNALQEAGIHDIDLDILYLPYARQDRVCVPGESFSLKVMCQMLNMLDVSTIRLWDVHNNEVSARLLNSAYVWHWEAFDIFARYNILNAHDLSNLVLCAPDKGAIDRVKKIVDHFDLQDSVTLQKHRDPNTGHISEIYFSELTRSVAGYDVMIVDDICDGGATFLMAAETLKSYGAKNLYLYVTHGIFSKGLNELSKHFEHIYCHHVLDEVGFKDDNRLTILRRFLNVSQPAVCY
jgi:ribose-phosphate pyrophosphokinase